MPPWNSVAMATPKVPVDQKLFERVWYMLKLKATKFQLPTLNGFWAVLKKPAGGKSCSPVQNRVKRAKLGPPSFLTSSLFLHRDRTSARLVHQGLPQSFSKGKVTKNWRHKSFSFVNKITEICRRYSFGLRKPFFWPQNGFSYYQIQFPG